MQNVLNNVKIQYYNILLLISMHAVIHTLDILIMNFTTNPLSPDITSPTNVSSQNTDFSQDSSWRLRNFVKWLISDHDGSWTPQCLLITSNDCIFNLTSTFMNTYFRKCWRQSAWVPSTLSWYRNLSSLWPSSCLLKYWYTRWNVELLNSLLSIPICEGSIYIKE